MNTSKLTRLLAALLLPLSSGLAQSAPKPAQEEAVVLSPFVVDATTDRGYQATATLAGSRLKTELKDVAASVSVLTNEFLDDLGVDDIASAMGFVAGGENDATTDFTQTNSLNQGYLGGDFGDVNTRTGVVRVRGLGSATTTANYIQSIKPTDRYNMERAEYLRGANSVLFGLAEPAGLINSSTKMANLGKNLNRVETRFDNFGSTRGVLDVSRVLRKDRLALRAVGLHSETKYEVDTAFQRDKRMFLTGTAAPFKYTTLRASYEKTITDARVPTYRTVQDNVSGWLTLHNQYASVLTPAQLAAAFYWDPTAPSDTALAGFAPRSIITVNGQTIDLGLLRRGMDGRDSATALFYDGQNWNTPLFGGATILTNRTITGGLATPTSSRSYFLRTADPRENTAGYVDRQVINPAIFPFEEVNLGALPGNGRWEKGETFNFTVDQRVMADLYVTATFQKERFAKDTAFSPISQQQQISIDINVKLPDGRVNPNFLRPFIYGRALFQHEDVIAENRLAQANYDFDFAKKAPRLGWLGFHRMTGLYTRSEVDSLTIRMSPDVAFIPGIFESSAPAQNIYQFWYVGDAVKPGDTGLRFTGFPATTVAHVGQSFGYTYFDNVSRTWKQSPVSLQNSRVAVAGGRNYTTQINEGLGASLQSFFWKRKIVTLFGWRKDSVDSFSHTLSAASAGTTQGMTKADYVLATLPAFSVSKATTTQSIVFHVSDWLRLFANRSQNFAAAAPRTDSLYRPIAPPTGKTDEVGLGLNLFDGKLNLRASAYQSSQILATSSAVDAIARLRIEAVEDAFYNALEASGRLAEWSTIGPEGKPTKQPYDRPLNIAVTEDSKSKGWEVELTYNPTRKWRIAASLTQLENTNANVGREVGDFLAARADFYRKYFREGLRQDGTNNTNPSGSQLLSDRFLTTVAQNYIASIVAEGTSKPGLPKYVGTLVTNYRFTEGWLKGISLGGNLRAAKEQIVGYRLMNTVFNVGGLENVPGTVSDPSKPFLRDPAVTGGLMANYSRKILGNRVNWKVQLNAQNLVGDHGLRQISSNPDGSPVWGVSPPRRYQLANSFDF